MRIKISEKKIMGPKNSVSKYWTKIFFFQKEIDQNIFKPIFIKNIVLIKCDNLPFSMYTLFNLLVHKGDK
jgi:hypothetical protein